MQFDEPLAQEPYAMARAADGTAIDLRPPILRYKVTPRRRAGTPPFTPPFTLHACMHAYVCSLLGNGGN